MTNGPYLPPLPLQSPPRKIKRCKALTTSDLVGSTQASPFSRGTEYLIEDGAGEHAIEKAIRDLYSDAHLRPVIDSLLARGGWTDLWSPNGRRADGSVDSLGQFCYLVETRLRSQISVEEAHRLLEEVKLACAGQVTPASILGSCALGELLKPKYLGASKLEALLELARHWVLRKPDFASVASAEVLNSLLKIKGIGHATALTFLVKALARPDVLVESDGLVRSWLHEHNGIEKRDTNEFKSARLQAAAAWKPWRSVAYLLICEARDSGSHKVHPLCEKQPRPGW